FPFLRSGPTDRPGEGKEIALDSPSEEQAPLPPDNLLDTPGRLHLAYPIDTGANKEVARLWSWLSDWRQRWNALEQRPEHSHRAQLIEEYNLIQTQLSQSVDKAVHAAPQLEASNRSEESPSSVAQKSKRTKGQHIQERMLATIRDNPEAVYWSARQWAEHLSCAHSTVQGADAWIKNCRPAREQWHRIL